MFKRSSTVITSFIYILRNIYRLIGVDVSFCLMPKVATTSLSNFLVTAANKLPGG